MPPEALKKMPYDEQFDMWSLGIILYVMIVGNFPFVGVDVKDLFNNIRNQDIDFNSKDLSNVSQICKDFLANLLEKD